MKDRIRQLRKALNLTQQEMADRIGVKRNTITTYEMGRNIPIPSVIHLICREFRVNSEWLYTGEGEMFLPEPNNHLTALAEQYGLTEMDVLLIEKYLNANKTNRVAINAYLWDVAQALQSGKVKKED